MFGDQWKSPQTDGHFAQRHWAEEEQAVVPVKLRDSTGNSTVVTHENTMETGTHSHNCLSILVFPPSKEDVS